MGNLFSEDDPYLRQLYKREEELKGGGYDESDYDQMSHLGDTEDELVEIRKEIAKRKEELGRWFNHSRGNHNLRF